MKLDAVVIDSSGVVIFVRAFPPTRESPFPIKDGFMIRLKEEQIGNVAEGYWTGDMGDTFFPRKPPGP